MATAPDLDIVTVLAFYADDPPVWPPPGSDWRSIRCPFPSHEDRHASGRISRKRNAYKCNGCDLTGDSWSIIKHMEGVDFKGAVAFAERELGVEGGRVRSSAKRRQPYRPSWT